MNKTNIIPHVCLIIFTCFSLQVIGQKHYEISDADRYYREGLELYQNEKYAAAQKWFEKSLKSYGETPSELKGNARFYLAMCAFNLYNEDAEKLFHEYVSSSEENLKINEGWFEAGKFQYSKKKFKQVPVYFSNVNPYQLNEDDRSEFYFKNGYSYFQLGEIEKARLSFYEVKDKQTKYSAPALYYYSHIAYTDKNYQTAIDGFLKLKNDEAFAPIVPYYITQCYYLQGKYEELLDYAPNLLDSVVPSRLAEMSKLIGDAYYRLGKFDQALPYLEKYKAESTDVTVEDLYQIGFCYYHAKRYVDAIPLLEKASMKQNEMAQNALHLLGDCYLKTSDKAKARTAFAGAASLDFDVKIKEDALFNYAVLTYETGFSPFNEAIKAFNEYITRYPSSKRYDDAVQYLVAAYMNTKNYKEALNYIEPIKNRSNDLRKAYQRVTFFRGLELYNDQHYGEALEKLERSLDYGEFDRDLKARTYYWIAESNYRLGNFDEAMAGYTDFMEAPGAATQPEFELANYNLGYVYFNKKQYANALVWFRKYESLVGRSKTSFIADTYNRIADCFFMAAKFSDAMSYYAKSIESGKADKDYAMFQRAFCFGLMGDHKLKIRMLNDLMTQFPKSNYCDDALYETGKSYLDLQQEDKSAATFQKLIATYPSSSYVKQSWIQIGLIAYNNNDSQGALAAYKKVVEQFSGTNEARSALTGIKTIYVEQNDVESYIQYTDNLGTFGNVSLTEQDSMLYRAAENLYMKGNCEQSKANFKSYLDKFPDGSFALNAWFYKGDCNYRNKEYSEALEAFKQVISRQRNNFTEESLQYAARISYADSNYLQAIDYYTRLSEIAELKANLFESRLGLMRSYFKLLNYAQSINAAKQVLSTENVPEEVQREARFIMAKSYFETNNTSLALEELKKVANNVRTVEGAESKYLIAEIYYQLRKYDDAEKEVFDFIDKNTPHQYWMARAFILLSDVYLAKKDDFQALQTLQSVLENYENKTDGIIDSARKKADVLVKAADADKGKKTEDIEINLNNQ